MDNRSEILGRMNAYCRAIDSGDLAALFELLRGAKWLVEGKPPSPESANNVILYEDGTPRTKHVNTNVQIDVAANATQATAHSYITVYQQVDPRPPEIIFVGEYFDVFEKRDGAWSFRVRDLRNGLYGDLSRHLKNPGATFSALA